MTGNKDLFSTYEAYDGGNVVFGSNAKSKIIGKALGWHLEVIHVTWAHLEKKRRRLQLYTKVVEEKSSQWLETTSEIQVTPSGLQGDDVRNLVTASISNRLKEALEDSTG
ncbi:hypothetical protein Tco_0911364 [Tanacetum coccineum]|uniref:Uncharacterized protein n=1 Tax=Tanacetum coccineum TaxID=301880 RepID=A0ABQ5D2P4_9ASTR